MAPDELARRYALKKLAIDETEIDALAAPSLDFLAVACLEDGEHELAEKMLRRARQRFPSDVWINYQLAVALLRSRPARTDEAIRYFTVVQSLRPTLVHELAQCACRTSVEMMRRLRYSAI